MDVEVDFLALELDEAAMEGTTSFGNVALSLDQPKTCTQSQCKSGGPNFVCLTWTDGSTGDIIEANRYVDFEFPLASVFDHGMSAEEGSVLECTVVAQSGNPDLYVSMGTRKPRLEGSSGKLRVASVDNSMMNQENTSGWLSVMRPKTL